jgi:hypothetical protein
LAQDDELVNELFDVEPQAHTLLSMLPGNVVP